MRVIFINPPSPMLLSDKGAPSMGILYLAAILREHGYEVVCWDMTGSPELADLFGRATEVFTQDRSLLLEAVSAIPDEFFSNGAIWAITVTSAQYHEAVNLLHAIKVRDHAAKVIIGGSHVSALPDDALHDGFHAVITGEADAFLVSWLDQGGPVGVYHSTAPRDLDRLPFPARDLIDLNSYCANLTVGEGLATTIIGSRGCPFSCHYCVRTLGDAARLLRVRDPWAVHDEVRHLDHTYSIERFVMVDDIWGVKRAWVEEFCRAFKPGAYRFRVNCRANTLHFDLLPAMKRAGIDVISFGFESGDERILHAISKNNVTLNTKAVHACHDAGIAAKAYLIFGFAEDDGASVEATCRWIEDAQPDSAQVAWLIPLPGTPIYRQAIAEGWRPAYHQLYHNGRDRRGGMSRLPWHTDETAEHYEDLCEWIEGYYAQPQPAVACPNALGE